MKNGSFGITVILMITIVLPVAADHYPQTRFQLSGGVGDKHIPNVEWNYQDDEYLAIWHRTPDAGYRDIKAHRVDRDGNLVGYTINIESGFADRAHPALAYNGWDNEYLAVYMKDHNNDGEWQIWGRLLHDDGVGMGDEFLICDWVQISMWTPRVSWNNYRNEYGVVWYGVDPSTGTPGGVGFRRVSADGAVLGNYVTVAAGNLDHQSDIAYNLGQNEYLVVWRTVTTPSPQGAIRAQRLSWDGIAQGSTISVTANTTGSRCPSVATNGQDLYVIAWEEFVYSDWDIHAQFHASSDGAVISGRRYISGEWDIDEAQPRVDVNGLTDQALVVYETDLDNGFVGRKIETAVINRFEEYPPLKFDVAALAAWSYGDPAIAWGRTDYISIYTSNFVTTNQEVEGCMMGLVHADGFESGNTAIWSESSP